MARDLPHPPVTRRKILRFKFLIPFVLVLSVSVIAVTQYFQSISYLLRPLWDTPPKPFTRIPHYYAPNISMAQLCQHHGWGILPAPRRVFDAVLFSNELDILEISYCELLPYVDRFVILEANSTFTGIPKSLSFFENFSRFGFAGSKIVYDMLSIGELDTGSRRQPFHVEAYHRRSLNMLIRR
jgi:beta-1,4-mannosyl-glycoprotein beta-1,4-N-acetylglucosaminyltransferase